MANNSEADAAIKSLNGRDFKGRTMKVNQAEARKQGEGAQRRRSF
jgi:RNA recognition motif-containing protein